jgi:hypothetical protein
MTVDENFHWRHPRLIGPRLPSGSENAAEGTRCAASHRIRDGHGRNARESGFGSRVRKHSATRIAAPAPAEKLCQQSRLLLVELRSLLRKIPSILVGLRIGLRLIEALRRRTLRLELLFDVLPELLALLWRHVVERLLRRILKVLRRQLWCYLLVALKYLLVGVAFVRRSLLITLDEALGVLPRLRIVQQTIE